MKVADTAKALADCMLKSFTVCYTCPRMSLPWVLQKVLQRAESPQWTLGVVAAGGKPLPLRFLQSANSPGDPCRLDAVEPNACSPRIYVHMPATYIGHVWESEQGWRWLILLRHNGFLGFWTLVSM